MPAGNSKTTIISMAIIASGLAALLHEGLGHGVVAWMRGDIPIELTSNHLSSLRPDRYVDGGGTIVNLCVGGVSLLASWFIANGANSRYFWWLLAAHNLLPGAGYFLFSGIFGFGDWQEVIRGLPHQPVIRTVMTLFGAVLYFVVVRLLAITVKPFCPSRATYNTVGRLPYYAACLFSCAAGSLDPLGLRLFLVSTVPAAFGGSSGLMWADSLLPSKSSQTTLFVSPSLAWWVAGAVFGLLYIFIIGRGIAFAHPG